MRKNLLLLLSVFLALPLAAQVQITGSAVQVGGSTASAGVSSAQGTSPIQVNGLSGTPASGDITIACPTCGTSGIYYKQQGTGTYFQLIRPTGCVATHTSGFSAECVGNNAGGITVQTGRVGDSYLFVYRSHAPSRSDTRWRIRLRNFFCNRQHECG